MDNDASEKIIEVVLAERFYRRIISSPGVAPNSFICFADGAIPISGDHMKWVVHEPPFDAEVGAQDDYATDAHNFSIIANAIPAIGLPWSTSPASLGPTFRSWLDAAVTPEIELSPDEELRLQEATNTIRDGSVLYHEYKHRWHEAQRAWQEEVRNVAPGPGHQKLVLTSKQATQKAMHDWQISGRKSRFESAVALRGYYLSRGFKNALSALRENYDKSFSMNHTRNGQGFVPVRLIPRDLFEGAASWTPIFLQASELTIRQETTSSMHAGGLEMPLFWTGDSGRQRTRVGGMDISKVAVSFEYVYAHIDRSGWFDSFLLTSNVWWWKGATKNRPTFGGPMFSNGAPPPNTCGEWQMIPVGIICTRNLVVTTDTCQLAAANYISQARSSIFAGFWIFTTRHTIGSPLAGSFDFELGSGSILRVPQVQIAAVVCQLMPKEPNPDPALLPDGPEAMQ
jgi:hypothetical protein